VNAEVERDLGDRAAVQADVGELSVGEALQRLLGRTGAAPGAHILDQALERADGAMGGDRSERERAGGSLVDRHLLLLSKTPGPATPARGCAEYRVARD
jgi:hypothetical protein